MSKTAEEILRKHEPILFDKDLGVQDMVTVISAMHEFAAQEVEAYKKHLREEVEFLNKTRHSWLLNRVLELIDTVK